MTRLGLVLAGLRHHARTHLGVLLGSAIGAAVLVGALAVGDSVRASLRAGALERIGALDVVLAAGDRFFGDDLAARMSAAGQRRSAAVVQIAGVASTTDSKRRANGVQTLGVDARFFELASEPWQGAVPGPDEVLLNTRLASQLGVEVGERIVLRVEKPSALPRDMALAEQEDHVAALRLEVVGVLPPESFGNFSLDAGQVAPYGAFVERSWLQRRLELEGRSNLLLMDDSRPEATLEDARADLDANWTLQDGQVEIEALEGLGVLEVTSPRIFLDAPLGEAAAELSGGSLGVLTYFVNELRVGERATPYSMVSAVAPLARGPDAGTLAAAAGSNAASVVPADLGDDEIVIDDWLAADLEAKVGDELALSYYVMGDQARLIERTREFRVRSVVPLEGFAADPTLMPDFPGLADSDSCRDWDPGFPLDLDRIRDEDETWWDERKGTPKAFVTLAAGREMWSNRFGDLSSVRVPAGADQTAELEQALRSKLDPAALGLFPRDLRGAALAGGTSATDFGGLFLGLSFFLILSALLLTAMLFAFGVEQRAREIGTLLAVGYEPKLVRWLFLGEAATLALVGSLLGTGLGLVYTRQVLDALVSVWSDAVAGAAIEFHVQPTTLVFGALGSFASALVAIALAFRAPFRTPAAQLLAGQLSGAGLRTHKPPRVAQVLAMVGLSGSVASVFIAGGADASAAAGTFFAAGGLLLIGGVAASRLFLARLERGGDATRGPRSLADLGLRNAMRRPGRSLATIALLASGTFLVLSVGANRLGPPSDASARDSGTGGFALFATSSVPIVHDLESEEGREFFALDEDEMAGVGLVAMRVRAGDEASCLNLGVPQNPRLVGVRPSELAERGAFAFAHRGGLAEGTSPWTLLAGKDEERIVPAIGDQASVTWVLKKKVGDTLDYVDERGRAFRVRLVATVQGSILQGNLVIDTERFQELFPSESGSSMFLVDAPPERAAEVRETLGRALSDVGLEVVSSVERLAEFNAVQNTYLLIFQALGFLGLLLGSVGLGMVVLRNALERRGELALLRAVGLGAGAARWMVLCEHGLLLGMGLGIGVAASLLALAPGWTAGAAAPALAPLGLMAAALASSGLVWLVLATTLALRGPLLDSLRAE